MKIIIKIFKGVLIGLGSILPGVSGGMIAASFNVYGELINALDNFLKKPIKSVLSIWEYLIGIVIGLGLGFVAIATVLKLFPLPITILFLGFIIGGIPSFIDEVKHEKKQPQHYIVSIIAGLAVLSVLLMSSTELNNIGSPAIYFYFIVIGFFIAISLIVPGLSGTMILMALGIYTFLITTVSDFLVFATKFDFNGVLNLLPAVAVMALSGFVTLIISSKLINKVLKNYKIYFDMAILGILLVSPINILWTLGIEHEGIYNKLGFLDIILSIVALVLGILLANNLAKMEKSEEKSNEV